jgi:polyisoprenoid-binding protein YceI
MKSILCFTAGLLACIGLKAQWLVPVDSLSTISFTIKNLGFNTHGTFSGLGGNIGYTPEAPATCHFDVQVAAETVNTGMDMRDDHLRKSDFFDVKNYPQISFVSEKITTAKKSGTLFVFGKLTMKGITRDISFPFTVEPVNNGYQFKGTFKLKRRDFNIGGGSTISDELTVNLDVFAKKP